MTDEQSTGDSLQFERAEFQEPRAVSCSQCATGITDTYYEVDAAIACGDCKRRRELERDQIPTSRRLVRSLTFGSLAGVLGAVLYWGITALTGYEFGLIAIVVGVMVGLAVRSGSYGKGGWLYQAIAIGLTYASIVSAYVPEIFESLIAAGEPGEPLGSFGKALAFLFAFAFALIAPVLAGADNLIGIIIIGIGLYEAWKINRRRELVVSGPYRLGDKPPAEPPNG